MKKKLITAFLGLVLMTNFLMVGLTPITVGAAGSDEIGGLIKEQLDPVQEIYGQDEVNSKTLAETISNLIKVALGFLGIIFLILILYAGFMWMTAAGNEDKISKAKDIIKAAVIGVAVIISAYAITFFVIDNILLATGASGIK